MAKKQIKYRYFDLCSSLQHKKNKKMYFHSIHCIIILSKSNMLAANRIKSLNTDKTNYPVKIC